MLSLIRLTGGKLTTLNWCRREALSLGSSASDLAAAFDGINLAVSCGDLAELPVWAGERRVDPGLNFRRLLENSNDRVSIGIDAGKARVPQFRLLRELFLVSDPQPVRQIDHLVARMAARRPTQPVFALIEQRPVMIASSIKSRKGVVPAASYPKACSPWPLA